MNRSFWIIIVVVLFLSVLLLARNQVARVTPSTKQPAAAQDPGLVSLYQPSANGDNAGTVKPPPAEVTICEDAVGSVGGVSTVTINNMAPGYCLAAFLRNHGFALGRIPDGAGKVLANITFLRVFY